MAAVDLDRQAIERRDFPIGRRGYDTASVDAHLQALGAEFEELRRVGINGGGEESLASTASTQVQSIIAAAETAAAELERQAMENAKRVRDEADRDAENTREQAIEKARAHVAAVAQTAERLLERVGSMDSEVSALLESLRAGGGRLTSDLAAVETSMGDLYDAAAGRAPVGIQAKAPASTPAHGEQEGASAPAREVPAPPPSRPAAPAVPAVPAQAKPKATAAGDLDGARLIALNMALNGESRADTERYLAENFELDDRPKLIDEVYAAIEA
jgi:hypothetical protein